jgi:putative Holliday junction resolvase
VSAAVRKAVLAIDHGTKRCGFAVADALRITSLPLAPFHGPGQSPELLAFIAGQLRERDIDTFLVGWPFNMDGTTSGRASDVAKFVDALRARFPAQRVIRYDERLTTKAAEELLRDAQVPPARRRELRDSFSALVLLRDWLASGEPGEPGDTAF